MKQSKKLNLRLIKKIDGRIKQREKNDIMQQKKSLYNYKKDLNLTTINVFNCKLKCKFYNNCLWFLFVHGIIKSNFAISS